MGDRGGHRACGSPHGRAWWRWQIRVELLPTCQSQQLHRRAAQAPYTACRQATSIRSLPEPTVSTRPAAGYNMVTGLGTPVANLLVPAMIAYQGSSPASLTAADVPANDAAPGGSPGASASVISTMNVANLEVGANHGTVRAAAPAAPGPMPLYAKTGNDISLLVPAAQPIQLNPTSQRARQQFDIAAVSLINLPSPNGLGTDRAFQSMVPDAHGAAEYPWPDLLRDVWDLGDIDLDGQAPPTDPFAQTDTAAGGARSTNIALACDHGPNHGAGTCYSHMGRRLRCRDRLGRLAAPRTGVIRTLYLNPRSPV